MLCAEIGVGGPGLARSAEGAPGARPTVNAEIRRLIEAHTPAEPIPVPGAGPHFALSPAHRIGLAAASDIDAAGNNLGRLRQQLPLVREAADDLAGRLNPNAFPELARNLTAYRAAIEGEPETIAWGVTVLLDPLPGLVPGIHELVEARRGPPEQVRGRGFFGCR